LTTTDDSSQRLQAHLDAAGMDSRALSITLMNGGRSNLTYRLDMGGGSYVLRRPPKTATLATAHDMEREYRILSALTGSAVPVPAAVHYCADPEVIGAPFYVMELCPGLVIGEHWPPELKAGERPRLSRALITVQSRIHGFDWRNGLQRMARAEPFMTRQLRRLNTQWKATQTTASPAVDEVVAGLTAYSNWSREEVLVHGDFRLNNTIIDVKRADPVAAVLDWELAAIGDPLADLALTLVYWPEASDPPERTTLLSPPIRITTLPGFLSRHQVMQIYEEQTGRDLDRLPYYEAFALFKLAVISQGIFYRYLQGDAVETGLEVYGRRAIGLSELALAALTATK
jgi:aminoglycoside phosphotransferase (APT) family kinase protein